MRVPKRTVFRTHRRSLGEPQETWENTGNSEGVFRTTDFGLRTSRWMSAYGYKRTFTHTLNYVRFTPESRHNPKVRSMSAFDPKRTSEGTRSPNIDQHLALSLPKWLTAAVEVGAGSKVGDLVVLARP